MSQTSNMKIFKLPEWKFKIETSSTVYNKKSKIKCKVIYKQICLFCTLIQECVCFYSVVSDLLNIVQGAPDAGW